MTNLLNSDGLIIGAALIVPPLLILLVLGLVNAITPKPRRRY